MKHARLHPVTGKKGYCGPSAVSAVTGIPVDVVEEVYKKVRGNRRPVTKTNRNDTHTVFKVLGYEMVDYTGGVLTGWKNNPTLARFLRERSTYLRGQVLLLAVGYWHLSHWVVVRGNKFVDSYTREPVWIRKAPHRRRHVHELHCLRPLPGCRKIKNDITRIIGSDFV